jgi:hypothetical protein
MTADSRADHKPRERLVIIESFLQKNEDNNSCRKSFDMKILFCSCFVPGTEFIIEAATDLARIGPKLEAFMVVAQCQYVSHLTPSSILPDSTVLVDFFVVAFIWQL